MYAVENMEKYQENENLLTHLKDQLQKLRVEEKLVRKTLDLQRLGFTKNSKNSQKNGNKLKQMQFGDLSEVHEVDILQEEEKSSEINDQKDKVTVLREELESMKTQVKILQEELHYQKKEELKQHRTIVDLRNNINTVKTYGRKLKLKNKREKEMNFSRENSRMSMLGSAKVLKKKAGGVSKIPDLILQEDIEEVQNEVKDLEARINHREAIIKIDK